MLLKLRFNKINRRFDSLSVECRPVLFLCLAFISLSLPLFAASDYTFKQDMPETLPPLNKTLSAKGKGKARALADYAVACIEFQGKFTFSKKTSEKFLSAVKNDPEAEAPLRILATYWQGTGKVDELIKKLLPVAQKNPGAIKLNILVARALISKKQNDKALSLLENILQQVGIDKKNGVDPELRAKLIMAVLKLYAEKKQWSKGEDLLDDALVIDDLKNLITTRLAASVFYSKCADQGPDGFFAGWSKRRYRRKLEENLTTLEDLCSRVNFEAMTLFPILDIYKRYSMNKRAEKLVLSQLLLQPDDAQTFILLAKVFDENKNYSNAFRVWKMIVDSPQYENIKRIWKQISKHLDGSPDIYYQLGYAALKCGRWDEAVNAFDWGLLKHPEDPKGLFQLGFAYLKMGKFKKAIYKFEKVADMPDATYFIAYCYRQLGDFSNALSAMDSAIEQAEKLKDTKFLGYDFYMEYLYIADKAGRFDKVEKTAVELLKKYPDDPSVNNFLGYLWADHNKKLKSAEKMIKKALDSDSCNDAYLDSMAWVLYRKKDYKRALYYIEKALKNSKSPLPDAVIRDHAGDIYYALGQKKMALKQWQLAIETYSDDLDLDAVKKKIDKLKK